MEQATRIVTGFLARALDVTLVALIFTAFS